MLHTIVYLGVHFVVHVNVLEKESPFQVVLHHDHGCSGGMWHQETDQPLSCTFRRYQLSGLLLVPLSSLVFKVVLRHDVFSIKQHSGYGYREMSCNAPQSMPKAPCKYNMP